MHSNSNIYSFPLPGSICIPLLSFLPFLKIPFDKSRLGTAPFKLDYRRFLFGAPHRHQIMGHGVGAPNSQGQDEEGKGREGSLVISRSSSSWRFLSDLASKQFTSRNRMKAPDNV